MQRTDEDRYGQKASRRMHGVARFVLWLIAGAQAVYALVRAISPTNRWTI